MIKLLLPNAVFVHPTNIVKSSTSAVSWVLLEAGLHWAGQRLCSVCWLLWSVNPCDGTFRKANVSLYFLGPFLDRPSGWCPVCLQLKLFPLYLELTSCCQDFYIKVIHPVTNSGVSSRTSLLIISELGMSWLCLILHHIPANNPSLPPLHFRNICLDEPGPTQGFFQKIKLEFSLAAVACTVVRLRVSVK